VSPGLDFFEDGWEIFQLVDGRWGWEGYEICISGKEWVRGSEGEGGGASRFGSEGVGRD